MTILNRKVFGFYFDIFARPFSFDVRERCAIFGAVSLIFNLMTILLFIFILLFCIGLSVLLYKIIFDSAKGKGNWGINLSLPNCPKCGQKVPAVRTPTSIRQALWGGWTCSGCGCEIDKWGKEISSVAELQNIQKQIDQSQEGFIKPFDEKGKTPIERVFQEKEIRSKIKKDL